jgi:hypothetical protein
VEWITTTLDELGFDPDDIDLYDPKLIDASTPLLDRRPVEIRNALGRQPKGLRDRLTSPARFVAKKFAELHDLPGDDPRWKPRPSKPKKAATPSTNGDTAGSGHDWWEISRTYYDPICDRLNAMDDEEFWEGDSEINGSWPGSLSIAFDDELDRVANFWERPKEAKDRPIPFTRAEVEAIAALCRTIDGAFEGKFPWPDPFLEAFEVTRRLPKCRLCQKRMAGEVEIVDGAHDFCVEEAKANNVTDITASDAYRRGVAKARAALNTEEH